MNLRISSFSEFVQSDSMETLLPFYLFDVYHASKLAKAIRI